MDQYIVGGVRGWCRREYGSGGGEYGAGIPKDLTCKEWKTSDWLTDKVLNVFILCLEFCMNFQNKYKNISLKKTIANDLIKCKLSSCCKALFCLISTFRKIWSWMKRSILHWIGQHQRKIKKWHDLGYMCGHY